MRQWKRLTTFAAAIAMTGASLWADTTLMKSGDWSDASIWSDHVPTADDLVTIGGGNTVTVTTEDAVAKSVHVADERGDGTLIIKSGGRLTLAESNIIGNAAGHVGKLLVDGGAFRADTVGEMLIGKGPGAVGFVEMTDGELFPGRAVTVGDEGTGTLKIDDGKYSAYRRNLVVGSGITGVGTVITANGLAGSNHQSILVGVQGQGMIHFIGGGGPADVKSAIELGPNSTMIVDVDESTHEVTRSGRGGTKIGGRLIVRMREGFHGFIPYVDLFQAGRHGLTGEFSSISLSPEFALLDTSVEGRIRARVKGENVVTVSPLQHQKMTYGMDFERLWHFKDIPPAREPIDLDALADWSTVKIPVDYVRIAINPAAELEEGKIHWEAYDQQLEMMSAIRKVRPDVKWFASPRPLDSEQKGAPFTSFPLWIGIWNNPFNNKEDGKREFIRLDPEKGAAYTVRYLRFMKEKGFKISFLDIINESTAHLKPDGLAIMTDLIRKEMGDDMPLVIACSAYDSGLATNWFRYAKRIGRTDFWDISSAHNTSARGSLEGFVAESKSIDPNRPLWNTELHGFLGARASIPIPAEIYSSIIFKYVRAGFSGLNDWLSLGNTKKEWKMFRNVQGKLVVMRPAHIWRELVLQTQGGHYVDSIFPGTIDSSMAFINKDNTQLTVWLLNQGTHSVDDMKFDFSKFEKTPQPLSVRYWGPDVPDEGNLVELTGSDKPFTYDIAGQTLYAFCFKL